MFKKLLVANRGEIAIRVLRAATELNLSTVAVYTYEDRYSLHRYKADEAYQIGRNDDPLKPYLDIEEIIHVAKREKADAIHPGYGFLSENALSHARCSEENIILSAPHPEVMEQLGDKIAAKKVAACRSSHDRRKRGRHPRYQAPPKRKQNASAIPSSSKQQPAAAAGACAWCSNDEELEQSLPEAQQRSRVAFGNDTVFFEKFIESPKHIEVQIMGDKHGNIVHLFERDCSVQRRFQKVVEVAPAISLKQETKSKLYDYAIDICKQVNYNNAGTVNFWWTKQENSLFYRSQSAHTGGTYRYRRNNRHRHCKKPDPHRAGL